MLDSEEEKSAVIAFLVAGSLGLAVVPAAASRHRLVHPDRAGLVVVAFTVGSNWSTIAVIRTEVLFDDVDFVMPNYAPGELSADDIVSE